MSQSRFLKLKLASSVSVGNSVSIGNSVRIGARSEFKIFLLMSDGTRTIFSQIRSLKDKTEQSAKAH